MKEIEALYRRLLRYSEDTRPRLDGKIRAAIFKKIMEEVDDLQFEQRSHKAWTKKYRLLDREIRMRLMKEIQVIIDDYIIARQADQLAQWEEMYGDIEHYKANFYRIRIDEGYSKRRPDLTQGEKFVKGEWEKVEYIKIR